MSALFSVAKFLVKTRQFTGGSRRADSSDSSTLVGDVPDKVEKILLPVPVASEVQIQQSEPEQPEPTAPQLESRTKSESSVPSEEFKTPQERQEDILKSDWTGGDNTIVHEPEATISESTEEQRAPAEEKLQGEVEQGSTEKKESEVDDPQAETKDPVVESTQEPEILDEQGSREEREDDTRVQSESDRQKSEVDPSVLPKQVSDLQDTIRQYEIDLRASLLEKATLSDRRRQLEEDLRHAHNVVDKKSEVIDRLLSELGRLKEEIRHLTQEGKEAIRRVEKEKEDLRHTAEEDREDAKKEIQRLKGIIAVERHTHKERAKEFVREKIELAAKLESNESDILALNTEVDYQKDRIAELEVRLEGSLEEIRDLHNTCNGQEIKLRRNEEDLFQERDKLAMKNNQIQFLETTNQSLSATLVEIQSMVGETERQNSMLMEQVRQQADQLHNRSYMSTLGAGLGRFMSSSTSFYGLTRGLRRGGNITRAETVTKEFKTLNDEIYQVSASLTDQLEGLDKRFVGDDSPFSALRQSEVTGVRRAKAEYLKSTLGLELIHRLERDAPNRMEDINPFFVQIALQGCLTACCMRIITSWYPSEWEYGRFLETLYERIRGTVGVDLALSWRKTTQQNCVPSSPQDKNVKLVDYLRDDLRAVLSVSGWSDDSEMDSMIESFREKLFKIVSMAVRLNTSTAMGVPGELEAILTNRGSLFNARTMVDDSSNGRSQNRDTTAKDETVICVVGLGLKWADNSDVDMPHLLLKPRVVLDSALS